MLDKTLPLLLLCACASTAELPTPDQPELAGWPSLCPAVASSGHHPCGLAGEWRHGTARDRLRVGIGPYPAVPEPSAFVLDIGPDGLQASAATFDRAKDGPMLAALVPEAVRITAANNWFGWIRANPWH